MKLITPAEQVGSRGKRGSQFSGTVHSYLTFSEDGTTVNTVCFSPGARTYWHSHERGQILQVSAGHGRVQSEGGDVVELHEGDTVWVPAGERHWHGAAEGAFMTHVAISLGATVWGEEVHEQDQAEEGAR